MPITITSMTDSKEAVAAAEGNLADGKPVENPAPEAKAADGKLEASEASSEKESIDETAEQKEEREEKGKKKGGFQKKIGKLTKQREEARQAADYWRQEALKHQKPVAEKAPQVTPVKADGRPDPNTFEKNEDYIEALADWKVEQKLSQRDQKQRDSVVMTEHQKLVASHVDKVKAFTKDHADFDEALEEINDIPMTVMVQQFILDSEDGPALMYALAKNPEEYARICKLPGDAASRALGRFEAKLEKTSESPKEVTGKTTKAPDPIKPVGAKGTGSGKKSLDDPSLSQREYEQIREEQMASRRA